MRLNLRLKESSDYPDILESTLLVHSPAVLLPMSSQLRLVAGRTLTPPRSAQHLMKDAWVVRLGYLIDEAFHFLVCLASLAQCSAANKM